VLGRRLGRLLAGTVVIALLAGEPAVAGALLTLVPTFGTRSGCRSRRALCGVPELRGRGLGSVLLSAAEAVVRERGGDLVEINVDGEDIDARRFYERHGYTNTERGQDEPLLYYYRDWRTVRCEIGYWQRLAQIFRRSAGGDLGRIRRALQGDCDGWV